MASRIKGITVEIGGDTTGLEKALKNVNSTIKSTQSELIDDERLQNLDHCVEEFHWYIQMPE